MQVKAIKALLRGAGVRGVWTFYMVLFIVGLGFADACRQIAYPPTLDAQHDTRSKEHRLDVQRFINQRNFYLHGMFLFVALCNKGLLSLNAKISDLRERLASGKSASASTSNKGDKAQ